MFILFGNNQKSPKIQILDFLVKSKLLIRVVYLKSLGPVLCLASGLANADNTFNSFFGELARSVVVTLSRKEY
jgi:hypothetical protein